MVTWPGLMRHTLLLHLALWAQLSRAKKPALPGSRKYWVELESLDTDAGPLHPRFQGHNTDFELKIQDPSCRHVTFQLGLNFIKYNLMFTPKISVNDEDIMYSPLKPIRHKIFLNNSIGPFDKKFYFTLADPMNKGQFFWSRGNTHTYNVRIRQPPQFGKVTQATSIVVTNSSGHTVESDPKFNASDPAAEYHFTLGETETNVDFKLTCSKFATKMMYDGELVSMDATKHVDLSETLEWRSLVECIYDDMAWTDNQVRRTYVLNFRRVARLGHDKIHLMMMPHHGYCTTRDDYEISMRIGHIEMSGNPEANEDNYLVCLSMVEKPEFIADHPDPRAKTLLVNMKTKHSQNLPNMLPREVPIKRGQINYKLELTTTTEERDFPVHIIHADLCANMKCPKGWIKKQDLGVHNLAADQMCLEEKCSLHIDKLHCCTKQPVRTKYVFGQIKTANEDGTYTVHFDEGGWDSLEYDVVKEHIRAVDVLENVKHEAYRANSYTVGQRVEARISETEAVDLRRSKVGLLGIATRELLAHFYATGCRPEAQECPKERPEFHWSKNPQHIASPSKLLAANKSLKTCYYDENCSTDKSSVGCNANNLNERCRWCGFGDNPECPKTFMCDWGNPTSWKQDKVDWCCKEFDYGCPWWCRWGKWLPDDPKAWGPWWSEVKQGWCCKHKGIGCWTGRFKTGDPSVIRAYEVHQVNSTQQSVPQAEVLTRPAVQAHNANGLVALIGASLVAFVIVALAVNRRRRKDNLTSRAFIPLDSSPSATFLSSAE